LLLFWLKKVDTSWAPVGETEMHISCGEKLVGIDAVERKCYSSWISQVRGPGFEQFLELEHSHFPTKMAEFLLSRKV
jgi:hypothetical protein